MRTRSSQATGLLGAIVLTSAAVTKDARAGLPPSSATITVGRVFSDGPTDLTDSGDSKLQHYHPMFVSFVIKNTGEQPITGTVEATWRDDDTGTVYSSNGGCSWTLRAFPIGGSLTGIVCLPARVGRGKITLRVNQTAPGMNEKLAESTRPIEIGEDLVWLLRGFKANEIASPRKDTVRAWASTQRPAVLKWVPAAKRQINQNAPPPPKGFKPPSPIVPAHYDVVTPSRLVSSDSNLSMPDVEQGQTRTLNLSSKFRYMPSDPEPFLLTANIANDGGQHLISQGTLKFVLDKISMVAEKIAQYEAPIPLVWDVLNWATDNTVNVLLSALANNCDGPLTSTNILLGSKGLRQLIDRGTMDLKAQPTFVQKIEGANKWGQASLGGLVDTAYGIYDVTSLMKSWPCKKPDYTLNALIQRDMTELDVSPALAQLAPGQKQIFRVTAVRDGSKVLDPSAAQKNLPRVTWSTTHDINGRTFGTFRVIDNTTVEYTPPPPPWTAYPSQFVGVRATVSYNGKTFSTISLVDWIVPPPVSVIRAAVGTRP